MINPAKNLPHSICIRGIEYELNTNFRVWLRYQQQLQAKQIFIPKYLFSGKRPPKYDSEVQDKLIEFLVPKDYYPREKNTNNRIDIDFLHDWDYIFASFWKTYGINLMSVKLHYHEYLALFKGLFLDYKNIIDIRNYTGDDSVKIKEKLNWQVALDDEPAVPDEFDAEIERQYEERVKARQKVSD